MSEKWIDRPKFSSKVRPYIPLQFLFLSTESSNVIFWLFLFRSDTKLGKIFNYSKNWDGKMPETQ